MNDGNSEPSVSTETTARDHLTFARGEIILVVLLGQANFRSMGIETQNHVVFRTLVDCCVVKCVKVSSTPWNRNEFDAIVVYVPFRTSKLTQINL